MRRSADIDHGAGSGDPEGERNARELAPSQATASASEGPHAVHRSLFRGIAWAGLARTLTQALSWASTLLVARLLIPADYGLVGMAALYIGLIRLISEFGLGSAVLVLRDLTRDQISQLHAFATLFGAGGFALTLVAAYPLGIFFHSAALPNVVAVSGVVSLIAGFRSVPLALLQRDRAFKEISVIEMKRSVVAISTVVALALLGAGYWSLVVNEIVATVYASAITWKARPVTFRSPHFSSLRSAMRFSRDVVVSRIAWYAYTNSDFLVAGRVLGEAALGVYTFAWTLTNLPVEKITSVVMSVTPTFFAGAQDDNTQLRQYLLVLTEGVALVGFPLAVGISITATDFISLALGPKWMASVGPLRILAMYTLVRSVSPFVSQALYMTGRVRHVMWNSVVSMFVFPPGFYLASHWGASGIAFAWVGLYPFVAWPLYHRLFTDIELRWTEYAQALAPSLLCCAAMACVVFVVHSHAMGMAVSLRFALEVGVGVIVYSGLIASFFRGRLVRFRRMMQPT